MPVIRSEDKNPELDEEDRKRFHYAPQRIDTQEPAELTEAPVASTSKVKATAGLDDYTRIELDEDIEGDQVHMRTDFLL
jgi:hypothetical protein